jgi:hypothetical protein
MFLNNLPVDIQKIIGKYVHNSINSVLREELKESTYMIRWGLHMCFDIKYPIICKVIDIRNSIVSKKPVYTPYDWTYKYKKCEKCFTWTITESNRKYIRLNYCCEHLYQRRLITDNEYENEWNSLYPNHI